MSLAVQTDFHDFSHRTQLGDFLNARGLTGKGVEVGTLFGAYATDILKTWQGHLHCVDPWINQPKEAYFDGANSHDMNRVFAEVSNGIGRHPRCTLHRLMSLNGVGRFEDEELDFVYLDSNHAVDHVRAEICAWWPKIKIGGIISGHDFFTRYDRDTNSDALTAVMELAEAIGIRPHCTWCSSWWFEKTNRADEAFRRACENGALPRPVYTDNTQGPVIANCPTNFVVVLPVARFDWNLAVKWLKWVARLAGSYEGAQYFNLVVWYSEELAVDQSIELCVQAEAITRGAHVRVAPIKEQGYFGTPNKMFHTAIEYCEREFPGRAVLWCEADTVPMRATWVHEIMEEYRACCRPFLADFQREGGIPHTTGNAVYHPNWRSLAPSLALLPGPVIECGWDSQCAHDLMPRCHPSKTIQQIWRPPLPITAAWAKANIRPETALFHQCKDGSLIDVLCAERGLPLIPLAPALCESTYETDKRKFADIGLKGTTFAGGFTPAFSPADSGPKVEILIVTFRRDLEMLGYCMQSIKRYARGFSGVTLAIPNADADLFHGFGLDTKIVTFDEPPGKGMLAHEAQVCRADELCPNADFILHVDADCLFWQPVTPEHYLPGGRCLMVREKYEAIAPRNPNRLIWRRCVEAATGITPVYETMVRHPQIYPRALYPRFRSIVEAHTKQDFDKYVLSCENGFPQSFAEHPSLGAVAIRDMAEKFAFLDYDQGADGAECGVPPGTAYQYIYKPGRDALVEGWSHSGAARYRNDWEKFLRGELPKFYIK